MHQSRRKRDISAGRIRSRAIRLMNLELEMAPTNGFVNLSMKVGRGRTSETRLEIGKELFDLLIEHLEPLFQKQGLAVSFEMRELEEKVKFNKKISDMLTQYKNNPPLTTSMKRK